MTLKRTGHRTPDCAMVMAAGKGTRMRPLTNDRPKPLVQVGPQTLLDHVLGHLRGSGVRNLVVNVHYLADQVEAHLATFATDFAVHISDERTALLETGGGLMQAKPLLHCDPFLCVNTDNVWTDGANTVADENIFSRLAAHWDDAAMDCLMLLVPHARAGHHAGAGDFFIADDGRLTRRGSATSAPMIWTGIQMLSHRLLVDPPLAVFSTNVLWDRALSAGRMFGIEHNGYWYDVGTPAAVGPVGDILAAQHG